jgi:endonuclease/exonuclease/phosphatase family metal-dependent hydrolase
MTFNLLDGGKGREQLIRDVFTAVHPDIILLQEVVYPDIVEQWAEELGMTAVVAGGLTYRHVAILSRYRIVSSHSHTRLPKLCRDFLEAIIEYQAGKHLTVFCVHLAAQPFVVFEWLRLLEIRSVLQHAVKQVTVPCIIGGDFNSVSSTDKPQRHKFPLRLKLMLLLQGNCFPHNVISTVLNAGFADCFRLLHSDPGFTLPPPKPTIRYDYIFANKTLQPSLQKCVVAEPLAATENASDHYAVVAEFAV